MNRLLPNVVLHMWQIKNSFGWSNNLAFVFNLNLKSTWDGAKMKVKKNLMRASLELKFNTRKVILSHQGPHNLFFEKKTPFSQVQD